MAVVEERALGTEAAATSTTQVVKTPSPTAIGDVMLLGVMVDGAETTPACTGWTLKERLVVTGAENFTAAIFEKIATEAGENSHTVTWGGASRYHSCQIYVLKNADATTPIASILGQKNAAAKSIKFPTRTPPATGCFSVLFGLIDQTGTGTPPTNWTEKQDNVGGTYIAIRKEVPVEATGEQTVTLASERLTVGFQIIVQPTIATDVPAGTNGKALSRDNRIVNP